jgi:hypothetical protein
MKKLKKLLTNHLKNKKSKWSNIRLISKNDFSGILFRKSKNGTKKDFILDEKKRWINIINNVKSWWIWIKSQ